jgi:bis(5'-nucleosyl)-tetraphosphatase (symmetrical)
VADYVIGDIQGCYDTLMNLLEHIRFEPKLDRLWCVGDLVNRGKNSLAVLRFFHQLPIAPVITLGNHDLYLLSRLFVEDDWRNHDDTIDEVLAAPDALALGHWLRNRPLFYHHQGLKTVMCHAGIAPTWSLTQAINYAHEVETTLRSPHFVALLAHMFGNQPTHWSETLTGVERLRCIINYFTRMRFCDVNGDLDLSYKGTLEAVPDSLIPWYAHPLREPIAQTVVFGHWAALGTILPAPDVYALDTGCVWGNALTALRLQDKQLFSVRAQG